MYGVNLTYNIYASSSMLNMQKVELINSLREDVSTDAQRDFHVLFARQSKTLHS